MAQGDSYNDPLIFNDFISFRTWMRSNDEVGIYGRLKDFNLDENGNFVGEGAGTEANPYVCNTNREMLVVTGALHIYDIKLIEEITDLTKPRMYWYNNGERDIYCLFDPTPSTINCNELYPTGTSNILCRQHANFNGWTLLNLYVEDSESGYSGGMFTSGSTSSSVADICEMNLANARYIGLTVSANYTLAIRLWDCKMQIEAQTIDPDAYISISYSASYGNGIIRSSLYLKTSCGFSVPSSGTAPLEDCVIEFDVNTTGNIREGTGNAYYRPIRSVIKGKIKAGGRQGAGRIFNNPQDSIYDFETEGVILNEPISGTGSIFNKDKFTTWTDKTGLVGVETEDIYKPSVLREKGLPIGVDA